MPEFNREGLSESHIAILENRPVSIPATLTLRATENPDDIGYKYPDISERWVDVTWREAKEWIDCVAAGLLSLDVGYEQRLAIAANTRIEWVIADLANNCIGGATTTIYPNTNVEDVEYILADSQSRVAVVENQGILRKVLASVLPADQLQHIILLDGEAGEDPRVITWAELQRRGAEKLAAEPNCVAEASSKITPNTLATLIYTSGTTGRPKGVELTHDNWVYQAASMKTLDLLRGQDDVHYIWLPMSHVFGKDLIVIDMLYNTPSAIDGRVDKIVANLGTLKPTAMCGAPRIFEKVRAAVMTAAPRSGIKGKMSRWAFSVGREAYPYRVAGIPMPRAIAARYLLADKLVFAKFRAKLGGNIRVLISGSAKLSPQVQQWFYSAGLTLQEGYGSTESTAIAFFTWAQQPRFGTVVRICPGNEVKISDDGEILLRGPSISRGYYNNPKANQESYLDGWLCTGDIGYLDDDNFLVITDRKKDLMKTSGGKYVSPQEVEAVVAANVPYLSNVVAVGEGRKYVAAIVTLDRPLLEKWAQKRNIDKPYEELTQLPEIRASIQRGIDRANTHLEKWETVKRFAILDHELDVSSGMMTPNMKVRRRAVVERYIGIVESLYDADIEGE